MLNLVNNKIFNKINIQYKWKKLYIILYIKKN